MKAKVPTPLSFDIAWSFVGCQLGCRSHHLIMVPNYKTKLAVLKLLTGLKIENRKRSYYFKGIFFYIKWHTFARCLFIFLMSIKNNNFIIWSVKESSSPITQSCIFHREYYILHNYIQHGWILLIRPILNNFTIIGLISFDYTRLIEARMSNRLEPLT